MKKILSFFVVCTLVFSLNSTVQAYQVKSSVNSKDYAIEAIENYLKINYKNSN